MVVNGRLVPARAAHGARRAGRVGGAGQTDGAVAAGAEPEAVAQLLLSISLGFVAQRALTGDADVQAHAAALAALARSPVRPAT